MDDNFQTVGWLIKELEEFDKDMPVIFLTDVGGQPNYVLSLYKHFSNVCIDIGDE